MNGQIGFKSFVKSSLDKTARRAVRAAQFEKHAASLLVTLIKRIFKCEVYQKRWRIEEYHTSIKQNATLEKSPTKVVRSQKNHVFASIVAYCKL
ncbi:MAG: hypothetical protein QRY74_05430 [Chlamydia sp.]